MESRVSGLMISEKRPRASAQSTWARRGSPSGPEADSGKTALCLEAGRLSWGRSLPSTIIPCSCGIYSGGSCWEGLGRANLLFLNGSFVCAEDASSLSLHR